MNGVPISTALFRFDADLARPRMLPQLLPSLPSSAALFLLSVQLPGPLIELFNSNKPCLFCASILGRERAGTEGEGAEGKGDKGEWGREGGRREGEGAEGEGQRGGGDIGGGAEGRGRGSVAGPWSEGLALLLGTRAPLGSGVSMSGLATRSVLRRRCCQGFPGPTASSWLARGRSGEIDWRDH